jgi:hypothetical protein
MRIHANNANLRFGMLKLTLENSPEGRKVYDKLQGEFARHGVTSKTTWLQDRVSPNRYLMREDKIWGSSQASEDLVAEALRAAGFTALEVTPVDPKFNPNEEDRTQETIRERMKAGLSVLQRR